MKALLCFGFALTLAAGQPGNITYGPTPASPVKPQVLVYVHGWSAGSDTWTSGNDMPRRASQAGYRTAFVDLYSDRSMWDNGTLLAQELGQIMTHYGTSSVTVVAHSKGGVDAQTCAVYNGMASHISQIITLGTPHRGTPLADLAWSSWAGWLAGLIGQKNEGNRVLQTGYMAWYRSQTDARPESVSVPMATAGGTKAGPFFSMYYWGGLAISGTSDGVVGLGSSHNPHERKRLFDRNWNHGELSLGVNSWAYLQAQIPTYSLTSQAPVRFMDEETPSGAGGFFSRTRTAAGPDLSGWPDLIGPCQLRSAGGCRPAPGPLHPANVRSPSLGQGRITLWAYPRLASPGEARPPFWSAHPHPHRTIA